jgi:flotillin
MAETAALAISNIKFDKVVVWENGGANGSGSSTTHFLQNLARAMPPMMQILKDIGGVELPEYLARLAPQTTNGHGEGGEVASQRAGAVTPLPADGGPAPPAGQKA